MTAANLTPVRGESCAPPREQLDFSAHIDGTSLVLEVTALGPVIVTSDGMGWTSIRISGLAPHHLMAVESACHSGVRRMTAQVKP